MALGESMKFPWKKQKPAETRAVDPEAANLDPDWNRSWAEFLVTDGKASLADVRKVATDLQRWILTSLLGINGAAAIALWGVPMALAPKLESIVAFVGGMVLALLCAELSTARAPRFVLPMLAQIGYWTEVQASGERDVAREEKLSSALVDEIKVQRRGPRIAGFALLLLFLVGIGVAGWGAAAPAKIDAAVKSESGAPKGGDRPKAQSSGHLPSAADRRDRCAKAIQRAGCLSVRAGSFQLDLA